MIKPNPKVSIIINNVNHLETIKCLESVIKLNYKNYDVIIVNHLSNSILNFYVPKKDSNILIIESPTEYSYYESLNKGIYYAINRGASLLLLLRGDTVINNNSLIEMVNIIHNDQDVAMVSGKIYSHEKPDVLLSVGRNSFNEILPSSPVGYGEIDIGKYDFQENYQFVDESMILVSSDVIKEIGAYNTFFFTLSEQMDFCSRIREENYKIVYNPNAKVWKKNGLYNSDVGFEKRNYWFTKNNYLFIWCNSARKKNPGILIKQIFKHAFSKIIKYIIPRNIRLLPSELQGNAKGIFWIIENSDENYDYVEKFRAFASEKYSKELFDYKNNIQTSLSRERDFDQLENLEIESDNVEFGVESGPSPISDFEKILNRIKAKIKGTTFIDLGSGRGRAILLATNYAFSRFIGVEFSNQLNQIAQTNIGQFKLNNEEKREIKVVNLDAVDFTFPLEPITLYMFNPFGPPVLVKVLNNLVASLNENPRPVWIVYYNSKHTSIFDSFGAFKKLFSDESPKYNRTWLDNSLPYTVYYADGIKN